MWMVDNNNHGKESKMRTDDPLFDRKLRPLMPRPISSCATKSIPFFTMSSAPSCFCTENPNTLPIWNHPIGGVSSDYGVVKREIERVIMPPLVSTRWNPTPEQLQGLEEMYRRGTRTPSAEQIQQIAARLRRFGKIEGKNVFYWFQNHKARERQKKRRTQQQQLLHDNHLLLAAGKKVHHQTTTSHSQTNQTAPGLSRRYFEIENHKKLATPANCSSTMISTPSVQECAVSMHGPVLIGAECKKLDVWTHDDDQFLLHHKELVQTAKINETASSWKLEYYLSSSSSKSKSNNTIYNTTNYSSSSGPGQENTKPTSFNNDHHHHDNIINIDDQSVTIIKENPTTLELFPIGTVDLSDDFNHDQEENINIHDDDHIVSSGYIGGNKSIEFIEFLPTKK